ncbi:MAG: VWA domain-containing protein [Candidatus Promineifilaceae bacterium]|nr:VWA domain-containing protein [Candidatus Promineifilaceae bacterium]
MTHQENDTSGNLLHNLILFGRLLRNLGLDVNPGRMIDLVQALEHIEIGRRSDFYYAARSLLVHNREELPLFDQAFDLFWRKRGQNGFPLQESYRLEKPESPLITMPPIDGTDKKIEIDSNHDRDELQHLIELTATYSRRELLRFKDFSELTYAEERKVKQFIDGMTWNLDLKRTRRKGVGRGDQPDFRGGFRKSIRYGGELLEWPTRGPKVRPRPLVIIADISGSMERYSRLLLHFIYGMARGLEQPVEAFVFSTRLTRITRQLRHKSIKRALSEVSSIVHDWAGGTRIGEALKDFNYNWTRRVPASGAIVMLISDGWDRGDPDLLQKEMKRAQRSCFRFIWLNPLLGSPQYEPLTRGMQAALPAIDDFLPVHNLASLEDLADHLAKLISGKRPFYYQRQNLSDAAFIRRHR